MRGEIQFAERKQKRSVRLEDVLRRIHPMAVPVSVDPVLEQEYQEWQSKWEEQAVLIQQRLSLLAEALEEGSASAAE